MCPGSDTAPTYLDWHQREMYKGGGRQQGQNWVSWDIPSPHPTSQHHSTLDIITFNCLLHRCLLHSSKESPRYKKRRSNVFKENVFVETFQEKSWIREWILEQSVSSSKLNQKALIKIQSHGDWRASGKDLLSSLGTYIALYFWKKIITNHFSVIAYNHVAM